MNFRMTQRHVFILLLRNTLKGMVARAFNPSEFDASMLKVQASQDCIVRPWRERGREGKEERKEEERKLVSVSMCTCSTWISPVAYQCPYSGQMIFCGSTKSIE